MKLGRQFVIGSIVGGLLLLSSCTSKKKPTIPDQAKVPVDTVPVPLPAKIAEEVPPPPPPAPKQETPAPQPEKPAPAKHHKHKSAQPPTSVQANAQSAPSGGAASSTASSSAGNTTSMAASHPPSNPAAEAPPPDTAIAANVSSAQLNQQKQTTAQLLEATEKTLGGLNRSLSHDEEEVMAQIRSYITQSRSATTAGDFERAYNLATKAHLLSDALAKK